MANLLKPMSCAAAALLGTLTISSAQTTSPAPAVSPATALPTAPVAPGSTAKGGPDNLLVVQASAPTTTAVAKPAQPGAATTATTATSTTTDQDASTESGGVGIREFQGDDIGQVLRLLARQSKVNMVVSDAVTGTVTMRLEDVTALQAIAIIVKAKGLFMDKIDNVYYIKTGAEKTAEPTESDSFQFSYARAKDIAPLMSSQLASKDPPQVDERTNTIFFRETRSNLENIRKLLAEIDKPTKQVMIEARLVEVTANPKQSYGINWAGVVGSSTNAQTVTYGGFNTTTQPKPGENIPTNGLAIGNTGSKQFFGNLGSLAQVANSGFAILSIPQMSATLRLLNEDSDAEFLANPRIVTADNQQAKIEISRNQPVPQLNFNEQTATAVFGGFQDKKFGNTLLVRPSVNKDNFVTLSVKPEISNKVGDATFVFAGATVASPVIDTRSLDSNVLIKSGDTLAIGGLLQDEQTKARNKVPVLGDLPVVGYLFGERLNARTKRNLLVFVTPTIVDPHYGTGLEDQASGMHHTGEEYADPNGWRNNAKGAVRLVPTAHRPLASEYPKPGIPPAPAVISEESSQVDFKSSATTRDE
ncbi:MAG: secretin N-terminal domain-containing protein [Chthoniobacterales bacterium]